MTSGSEQAGIPERADGPVRVVIDTDAANEIDDQFALAWAFLAPDHLELQAVHAAPYGHGSYLASLLSAQSHRSEGPATMFEELAMAIGADQIAAMTSDHPPAEGMERSSAEIRRVLDAAAPAVRPPVVRGAEQFMSAAGSPIRSDATENPIDLAHARDDPLYVAVLGAPTNVASALLVDPTIAPKLVIVFVAGYPSSSAHVDDSFNLVQDRLASQQLFAPDTNLVYIPGYQVAETLSVSLPELEQHVAPHGQLGALLHRLYLDNPLATSPTQPGHSWVMWDLAPIAWLIDRGWIRTTAVAGATIGADHRWHPAAGQHLEAFRVDRRAIYTDLFTRLKAHEQDLWTLTSA